MTRPRLFYVLDSLEENEAGDHVVTLLARLPRSQFEPRVVALAGDGALGSRIREMKVTLHRMELSGTVGALLAVPRLRRLLAGSGGDVLHTFQPWAGAVAQLAAPRGSRVFRWVDGRRSGPPTLDDRLRGWVDRWTGRGRDRRFFVPEEGVVADVRARYGVDRVEVVPECVDLDGVRERVLRIRSREARIHLGMGEGERGVLCFTDFLDRGRMSDLLEGFAVARTEVGGLRLFVHGRGPEEGAARGRAEDLRLEDSVVFVGAPRERGMVLRAADAVLDAGTWPGWCRGAVEAMSVGLPVLRWVGGVGDPGAGPYPAVTGGPSDRFARHLLDLLADDALRTRVAERSAAAAERHDVARIATRWVEFYAS